MNANVKAVALGAVGAAVLIFTLETLIANGVWDWRTIVPRPSATGGAA